MIRWCASFAACAGFFRQAALLGLMAVGSQAAVAGLFDDDEARRAILELRKQVDELKQATTTRDNELAEQLAEQRVQFQRSLLELNAQIELLRQELATLRGQGEQQGREMTELKNRLRDMQADLAERIRRLEPAKVVLDGVEFLASPEEVRSFEVAMGQVRAEDYDGALLSFQNFQRRFPASGYFDSASFWRGNALYAKKDYKEAINAFRSLISMAPAGAKAPDSLLSIASCQAELKDIRAARKTLEELIKSYPKSEAATTARERLAILKP
jgi:tol-pal system protein YbgF